MPSRRLSWLGQVRWAFGLGVVLTAAGLAILSGWKLRQVVYRQLFEELLQRAYLLEPVLRPYLAENLPPLGSSAPPSGQKEGFGKSFGKEQKEPRLSEPSRSPAAASAPEAERAAESMGRPIQGADQGPTAPRASVLGLMGPRHQTIQELCEQMGEASHCRITLILPNGAVLGDSEEKAELMEPHGTRPEIAQALQGQAGSSCRYSHTLRQWMFYAAVPVRRGEQILGVVRVSKPKQSVDGLLWDMGFWIVTVSLGMMGLAGGWGFWYLSRLDRNWKTLLGVVQQLAQGDYTQRFPAQGPPDLRQLADWLNHLAQTLQGRQRSLQAQQSELQAILASMSEGVLAVDGQRRTLCMNRSAAEMLDIEEPAGPGRLLEEISRHPELNRLVEEVWAAGQPTERPLQLPGPPVREVQLHGSLLRDAEDQPLGVLVVLRDVTRLRQLEKLRRDFVANVSHELKTPLTSIAGFVEALQQGALENPEQAKRFLEIIAAQTQRMQNLIEDLLSLSRVEQEAERRQIPVEVGPIREVLESAVDLCRPKAEQKNITIQLDCPADLQAPRNAALLEQAVVNLLDNAIQYSAESQQVRVQAAQEGQEVVIRVQDHGCGIPPEHLDRIFERFYRVDKARSRKLGGTGLGLAIVKHIALAHGGRVAVQSQVGQGSLFSIYLPTPVP